MRLLCSRIGLFGFCVIKRFGSFMLAAALHESVLSVDYDFRTVIVINPATGLGAGKSRSFVLIDRKIDYVTSFYTCMNLHCKRRLTLLWTAQLDITVIDTTSRVSFWFCRQPFSSMRFAHPNTSDTSV